MKRLAQTPPEPEVRAGTPEKRSMKRLAFAIVALAVVMMPTTPAGAAEETESPSPTTCQEPVVSREYTTESMTYRLAVDLHGCDWWDGSPLMLVIFLSRDDGETEESGFSPQACEGVVGNEEDPYARPDKVGCEVSISVEHPSVEVAHYVGAVSYVWQDGPQTASFDTTCVSSPTEVVCRDDYAPAARAPGVHT
jgi:hypothetical protein